MGILNYMNTINRIEITERFAAMWRSSREHAGKSQDYMAKALGVSKKTVQNWEAGTSCPSQEKGFEWFMALDLQPLPYYLQILYPAQFENINDFDDEEKEREALITLIRDLPPDAVKKLLYLLAGEHGSSGIAVLEMITAHLQAPLRDRITVAQSIETNYHIAENRNELRHPNHIQPDIELLSTAIKRSKESVINGDDTYTSIL